MNVNEIRDRILEISHDEVAPDTNLKLKSLSWLNSAYQEIVGVCMPYLERYIESTNTVEVASGTGILPCDVYRVLAVVDTTTGRELRLKSHADIVKKDANLTASGAAHAYWIDGRDIKLYPQGGASVKVVYLRQVTDLLDGGAETEILIPNSFITVLFGAGLFGPLYLNVALAHKAI
ncbi:MAG: hypothetical protein ACI9TY_001793 [Alphaproteobacteria bacterium]|jgi:hypothetical protein